MIFDEMGVHIDGSRAAGKTVSLQVYFTDIDTRYLLTLEHCVLNYAICKTEPSADVTMRLKRETLDSILLGTSDVQSLLASGDIVIDGAGEKLAELFSLMGKDNPAFDIVTP